MMLDTFKMATARSVKPWKLSEDETFTSYTSWQQNITYCLNQDKNCQPFLLNMTWTKISPDHPTRGLQDDAAARSLIKEQKLLNLNAMLGYICQFIPRKRGKRGGVRNKIRARKYKPFVPPVTFGNCRSIHNKIDELRANCRFLHNYRESCCIALTETWLHETVPDSAVEPPNFTTIRSDRKGELSKTKGAGVMLYINNNWCNNIAVTSSTCDNNIEALTLNLRPFYLPREFTNIYITVVYIPPSGNKTIAAEYINELTSNLSSEKPDSLQIVLGDMNRCKLKIPNFTQYVSCTTRKDARLDEFLCVVTQTDT